MTNTGKDIGKIMNGYGLSNYDVKSKGWDWSDLLVSLKIIKLLNNKLIFHSSNLTLMTITSPLCPKMVRTHSSNSILCYADGLRVTSLISS